MTAVKAQFFAPTRNLKPPMGAPLPLTVEAVGDIQLNQTLKGKPVQLQGVRPHVTHRYKKSCVLAQPAGVEIHAKRICRRSHHR